MFLRADMVNKLKRDLKILEVPVFRVEAYSIHKNGGWNTAIE